MGTKANPAPNDCYAKAAPDEPMFVLLARDPIAPILVTIWAYMRQREQPESEKPAEAIECADQMMRWYEANIEG